MGSFSGYKLVGVNPHSTNVGVAMMLADFITNEDNQIKRFNDRKLGPSNINANATEAVQSAPAIAALAEQSSYATLQRVGANYWSSAASLGEILASGDTQGKTTQQLMDDAVAGITAPVAQ
jgi:arabinogalactan oligomer/maltooligosaccharide transport system substrate-binding protein